MSKHANAEDKLHISPSVRGSKLPRQKRDNKELSQPSGPPKGTNANNQYR